MSQALDLSASPPLEGVARKPLLTIRPSAGWRALDLRQVWLFRDLLTTLGQRDLKLRYKQTALGVIWVVLQPLMAAGIFSFVFGTVAKLPSDGLPYFLFAYAGLLGWSALNGVLTRSSICLVGNANIVSKVFFPRLVLPLSTLYSNLVDFAVGLGMLIFLLAFYRVLPGWGVLLFPVMIVLLMLLGLGVGLTASALMVSYRDVQYILPVATQFLMYASPIAYSVAAVPASLQPYVFLNPLSAILEGMRWSLFGGAPPPLGWLLYSVGFTAVALLLGAVVFKTMEKKFADVI